MAEYFSAQFRIAAGISFSIRQDKAVKMAGQYLSVKTGQDEFVKMAGQRTSPSPAIVTNLSCRIFCSAKILASQNDSRTNDELNIDDP